MRSKPVSLPDLSDCPFARNGHIDRQFRPSLELNPQAQEVAAKVTGDLDQTLEILAQVAKIDPSLLSPYAKKFIANMGTLSRYYRGNLFSKVKFSIDGSNVSLSTEEAGASKGQVDQSRPKEKKVGISDRLLRFFGLQDFQVQGFDTEGGLKKLQEFFGVSDANRPKLVENNPELFKKTGGGGAYNFMDHSIYSFTDPEAITQVLLGSIPASFGSMKPSFHRLAFLIPSPVKKLIAQWYNKSELPTNIQAHEYTHSTQGTQMRKLTQAEIEEVIKWYVEHLDERAKKVILSGVKEDKDIALSDEDKIVKALTSAFSTFPQNRTEPISEEELATSKWLLINSLNAMLLANPAFRNGSGLLKYALNPLEMEARLGASAYVAKSTAKSADHLKTSQKFLFEVAVNDQLLKIDEMKRNGATVEQIKQEEKNLKEFIFNSGIGNMNNSSTLFFIANRLKKKEENPGNFAFVDKWIDKVGVTEKKISGGLASLGNKFVSLLPQAFQKRLSD